MYNDLPERAEQLDVLADDAPVTTIVKNEIIDGFVNKYRNKKGTFSRNPKALADKAAQRFGRNIFKPRREDEIMLRLLGEIEDPAEAYIRSVGDLAETLAVDRFNKFLRANRGRIETLEDGSKVRVGGDDIIDGEAYMALPEQPAITIQNLWIPVLVHSCPVPPMLLSHGQMSRCPMYN